MVDKPKFGSTSNSLSGLGVLVCNLSVVLWSSQSFSNVWFFKSLHPSRCKLVCKCDMSVIFSAGLMQSLSSLHCVDVVCPLDETVVLAVSLPGMWFKVWPFSPVWSFDCLDEGLEDVLFIFDASKASFLLLSFSETQDFHALLGVYYKDG